MEIFERLLTFSIVHLFFPLDHLLLLLAERLSVRGHVVLWPDAFGGQVLTVASCWVENGGHG